MKELKTKKLFSNSRRYLILLCIITIQSVSCKRLVEIDAPTTSLSGKNVYSNDATAIAVLTGIYSNISAVQGITNGELPSIGFLTGLSGDELTLYDGIDDTRRNYYQNSLTAESDRFSLWSIIYPKIYTLNSAIEGITRSNTLTGKIKQQLLGEAKFMRAFCYFYLVNLYGDVPIVTSSDYRVNLALPRAPKDQVWSQIIIDLKDAQILLSREYLDITLLKSTSERVRPNKWTATALLARVYLYREDWGNAEMQASMIISNSEMYHLEILVDVFKNTSAEAIWQLQPVNIGSNTEDAKSYVITDFGPGSGANGGGLLSKQLLESFDRNDLRLKDWVGVKNYMGVDYYYPYKYKLTTGDVVYEYQTIFRLSEIYLIQAEALAEQGDYQGAIENLDVIRERAGLPLIKSINPNIGLISLRSAIMQERQHELFTEWGHRWLDLKRRKTIDAIMGEVATDKHSSWNPNWQWYPIPSYDILHNGNLIQNRGY